MEAEGSYHFDHWLHVSKNSSALWFYALFFIILYMYVALGQGQGQTTHYSQNFYVNRKASSLWSFVASFKNISSEADPRFLDLGFKLAEGVRFVQFDQFFPKFPMKWHDLGSRGGSFKPPNLLWIRHCSSTSDFIHIFSWFNECIQPHIRGRRPPGDKFWCQQKPLVTSVSC